MIENIINVRYKMELETNSGTIIFEEEDNVTGFVKVMLSRGAIANIFALRDLKNVYRVAYDSAKWDDFVAHMDKKEVKFQCNEQGMYTYKADNSYLKYVNKENLRNKRVERSIYRLQTSSGSQFITVNNRIEGFIKYQVKQAQKARRLYHRLLAPTMDDMKMIVCQNLFKNCHVTTKDFNLDNIMLGPDISTSKGQSTCPKFV